LRADGIATGWLRPWLWRQGWMVPPPRFLPVFLQMVGPTVIGAAIYTLLILSGWRPILIAFVLAMWLTWLLSPLKTQRWLPPILQRLCLVAAWLIVGVIWFTWLRPQHWPERDQIIAGLWSMAMTCGILYVIDVAPALRARKAAGQPRWSVYLEAALVERVF
jgi:hypothetical protein